MEQHYCQLVASKNQLDVLREQNSVGNFFAVLKHLGDYGECGDSQLMQALHMLNRQLDSVTPEMLAGNWFASAYHNQTISWCAPCGAATQAFLDQYIGHCQQQMLNQFVRPRTSLQALLSARFTSSAPTPAGFIFHLSRCGSTLISGCLAEIDSANVLSEPPVITELMLDANLHHATQMAGVKQILHAQYLAMPNQPQLIVKWNAWDLLRWNTIRAAWSEVPIVLLIRDPLEILASHERQAGRHMAGDPSMAQFHPVFSAANLPAQSGDACFDLLARRVAVLRELLQHVQMAAADQRVMLVDYRDLNAQKMLQIARFFRMPVTTDSEARIGARMQFHSKDPAQKFQPDSIRKRESLSSQSRAYIQDQVYGLYQQLRDSAAG